MQVPSRHSYMIISAQGAVLNGCRHTNLPACLPCFRQLFYADISCCLCRATSAQTVINNTHLNLRIGEGIWIVNWNRKIRVLI